MVAFCFFVGELIMKMDVSKRYLNVRGHSHLVQYKQHSMRTIWAYCHYLANWLDMSEPLKPNSRAPWFVCFKRAPFANILEQVQSHSEVSC